jgi:hypothetical protein
MDKGTKRSLSTPSNLPNGEAIPLPFGEGRGGVLCTRVLIPSAVINGRYAKLAANGIVY